jgi:hypothetical protein
MNERRDVDELWRRYRCGLVRLTDLCEHKAWRNMRYRCKSLYSSYYQYYRGRGIVVAPEFESFWTFLFHVCRKPTRYHSIDRIDNDRDYEYFNIRWATAERQAEDRMKAA